MELYCFYFFYYLYPMSACQRGSYTLILSYFYALEVLCSQCIFKTEKGRAKT